MENSVKGFIVAYFDVIPRRVPEGLSETTENIMLAAPRFEVLFLSSLALLETEYFRLGSKRNHLRTSD